MDEVIKDICQTLKEEVDAVISYQDKITIANVTEGAEKYAQIMESNLLDKVSHIQNLCLELTRVVTDNVKVEPKNEQ